jgi:hypothetical protein
MINRTHKYIMSALLTVTLAIPFTHAARGNKAQQDKEPDYTQGEKLLLKPHVWSIGPTGASGVMWYKENRTDETRMIQIDEVEKGTPSDGILRKGDVILGVGQQSFQSDPRKAMATAIGEAEAADGKLQLMIWRPADGKKGETMSISIALPILGAYSATSPWRCEKTEALVDNACAALVNHGLFRKDRNGNPVRKAGVPNTIDALGLLSTGDKQYMPVVTDYINIIKDQVSKPEELREMKSWYLAYYNILLCEYFLMTSDKDVLPTIQTIAARVVDGRSGVGTWSHSMRLPGQNFASAYGSMNQIGLTLTISLILAQKCGVEVKDLDTAINQSLDFFRYFYEKGSIPYGDHQPGNGLAGNGKSAQTAVMFNLAGEKAPATYFTCLTIASYNQLEDGHTGHFFNGLWGPMGAACGGPEAAASYSKNVRWFTETERRFDGSFVYQPGYSSGELGKYTGWSTAGSRLLQYCLPRKQLYITGKGESCVPMITGDALQAVAEVGNLDKDLKAQTTPHTTEELLAMLRSWSPAVREAAARQLGQQEDDVVDRLIAMLDSSKRFARYGACDGLAFAGRNSAKAVEALVKRVQDADDMNLRYFASKALQIPRPKRGAEDQYRHALGDACRQAGPAMLALLATRQPGDESQDSLYGMIAETLFYGGSAQGYEGYYPHGEGLDTVDRKLIVPAIKALLANRNGRARGAASSVYPHLTAEELAQLWPDIYRSTKYQAPSGVMFSAEVRANGLALLADKGYQEGIELAMEMIRQEGWGHHKRNPAAFAALAKYGGHIKPYLPELKTYFDDKITINKKKIAARPDSKFVPKLRQGIATAEAELQELLDSLSKTPELKSLETDRRENR